jgi:hypothetical protein
VVFFRGFFICKFKDPYRTIIMNEELRVPEGWEVANLAEKAPEIYGAEPGPQTGEDDYHSRYVDPEGPFGATKVSGAEDSYGGEGGEGQEKPEGTMPMVPHDWGLQASKYPKRHSGVATSY